MGIISWIVMGLIVGLLAKFIMPGKDPGGIIITILIGIGGALLGGYLGTVFGLGTVSGFGLRSILLATGGAVIILAIYHLLRKK
ncbi:MAG: GlsB/YeaQ/YmgE family stress response membrane protein [Bacteroidota bacterium]|nr:GlsB/YeaQ/YmgE family stress response membrane protein [Bacteroidota bacterium]